MNRVSKNKYVKPQAEVITMSLDDSLLAGSYSLGRGDGSADPTKPILAPRREWGCDWEGDADEE